MVLLVLSVAVLALFTESRTHQPEPLIINIGKNVTFKIFDVMFAMTNLLAL